MPSHTKSRGEGPIFQRRDAANLPGLTALMNPQHMSEQVDPKGAEYEVMGREKKSKRTQPPKFTDYDRELTELADKFEINIRDLDLEKEAARASPIDNGLTAAPIGDEFNIEPLTFGGDSGVGAELRFSEDESSGGASSGTESESEVSDDGSALSMEAEDVLGDVGRELGVDLTGSNIRSRDKVPNMPYLPSRSRHRHPTEHDYRRQQIDDIIGGEGPLGGDIEQMRESRAERLEQIAQLCILLKNDGADIDDLTMPTRDSSDEEIDSVLNALKMRNDRNRYSSLAEEVIVGMAEMLEATFDGTRPIPGLNIYPDYTGYSATARVKLHRTRFETAQVVGNFVRKNNIGPIPRILMELVPSLITYPRQREKQKGQPTLRDELVGGRPRVGNMSASLSNIRTRDGRM